MHKPLLRRAANPAPYRILGLVMRPFSLGHAMLISGDESIKTSMPVALASAAWICSNTWAKNRGTRTDRLASLKMSIWKWRCRKADFPKELAAFQRYVKAGSLEFPISDIYWPGRFEGSRNSGAPLIIRIHDFLCEHFNYTDEEAWDHPFGYAKMRWATHREAEGCLDIQTQGESEFDRKVREENGEEDQCLV